MSFKVYFSFSVSLKKAMRVPKGTVKRIQDHIAHVGKTLGLKEYRYKNCPPSWAITTPSIPVSDEVWCNVVSDHNQEVRWFYQELQRWTEKPLPRKGSESFTVAQSREMFGFLVMIDVPPAHWTRVYYRERMDDLYEVMRGRPTGGMVFDTAKLSIKQAAAVIRLFEQYLETDDLRLDVPRGMDKLCSSYDGEYQWCDECCAPISDDYPCRHRRKELNGILSEDNANAM